jgi:ppGpp synthetase/RelA/SpoT-type nucleotidyltranferase
MDAREQFDFEQHKQQAMAGYARVRHTYETLATTVREILRHALSSTKVHSIEARAKTIPSFGDKAATPDEEHSDRPKYADPISEITDKAGVRVILFFPRTLTEVEDVIRNEFTVVEKVDHTAEAIAQQRLGYLSVHYVVEVRSDRLNLPEYRALRSHRAEIQVRTVMQHAWAEIEHDIQYKSTYAVPVEVRRRFITLAGLLEIADREFQAIQDLDARLREIATQQLSTGDAAQVVITAASLKTYLDQRFGSDARHTAFSYEWMTKIVLSLGFTTFGQIDELIQDLDPDDVSLRYYGNRQSQLTRFELTLLAAMKDDFIARHPWHEHAWFQDRSKDMLKVLFPEDENGSPRA